MEGYDTSHGEIARLPVNNRYYDRCLLYCNMTGIRIMFFFLTKGYV